MIGVGGVAEPPKVPRVGGSEREGYIALCQEKRKDWWGSGKVQHGVERSRNEKMGMESGEVWSMVDVYRESERFREEESKVEGRGLQGSGGRDKDAIKRESIKEVKRRMWTSGVADHSSRKRKWGETDGGKLQRIEHVDKIRVLQARGGAGNDAGDYDGRLHVQDRYQESISRDKGEFEGQQILENSMERCTLRIPSVTIGSGFSTENIQCSHGSSNSVFKIFGDTNFIFRGRHTGTWEFEGTDRAACTSGDQSSAEMGVHHKREEIIKGSSEGSGVSGSSIQHRDESNIDTSEKDKRHEEMCNEDVREKGSDSERSSNIGGENPVDDDSIREVERAENEVGMEVEGNGEERLGHEGKKEQGIDRSVEGVGILDCEEERMGVGVSEVKATSDDSNRCGSERGSSKDCDWKENNMEAMEVEYAGEKGILKLSGVIDVSESDKGSEEGSERNEGVVDNGFKISGSICEEDLWEDGKVSKVELESVKNFEKREGEFEDKSSIREGDKTSGQDVEGGGQDGLRAERESSKDAREEMGNNRLRLDGYEVFSQGTKIHIIATRRESSSDGCIHDRLESLEDVLRISTASNDIEGGGEDYSGWSESDNNSAIKITYVQQGHAVGGRGDSVGTRSDKGGRKGGSGEEDVCSGIDRWVDVQPKPVTERNFAALNKFGKDILFESTENAGAVQRLRAWKDFERFMIQEQLSVISPEAIVSFLGWKVFCEKVSAGVIEAYRTAICSVIEIIGGKQWGTHPLIARAVRAARRLRPVEARYSNMWNAKVMWDYCSENKLLEPVKRKELRMRTLCLLRLNLAARTKDIERISRKSVKVLEDGVQFQFYGWKTQRYEGTKLSKPIVVKFMNDPNKCAAKHLIRYMESNEEFYSSEEGRQHDKIWIWWNSGKPLKTQTLATDAREMMRRCGIDVNLFKPATLRHAAITFWRSLGESREKVAERTMHRSLNIISFYYDKAAVSTDLMAELESRVWARGDPLDDEESEEEFEEEGVSVQ